MPRTRHLVTPRCKYGCKFLQITDELWLCPHASFGEASYKLGAVEEARRLLERAGGYDKRMAALDAEAERRRAERAEERADNRRTAEASIRYS